MHCTAPGFFRLCFASQAPDTVAEAVERLARCLGRVGGGRGGAQRLDALTHLKEEVTL
jgi:hypothetical protein